jgi:serine-type D-Ala-D-Ala carboxypeptidase/endopeptidase (penicillin-binding protein 4)
VRRRRAVVLGGLGAIALAGCGGTAPRPRPTIGAARVPVPVTTPTVTAPPVPPKAPAAAIKLTRALDAGLHAAGRASGAVVYDLTAGQTLYSARGAVTRPPASVEKLYTSLAVLSDLGPDLRLQTEVLGQGHLGPGGVWHGNLYLQGGGDPTFGDGTFNRVWEGGYGPTAQQVASQLGRDGIRRVTGWLIGDGSLFDSRRGPPSSGYGPDIPDLGGELAALTYDHGSTTARLGPPGFAARELAMTMRGARISVRASPQPGVTPADALPLVTVTSPPMSVLLRLMDVPSDDFFAEMLTKQLGVRFGGAGTTAAGASVIGQAISRLGVMPTIVDGSGLSRRDQTSPAQVVAVLRAVWRTPNGRTLLAALPVVGVNGTVQRIGQRTAAQGRCQAKTGTLDNVTNLAGYCRSRSGHELAFAVFLDGPTNAQGTLLLSREVGAIAGY